MMKVEELREHLNTSNGYFIQFFGQADITDGFKLSIQGNTIDDACYLYENLLPLLVATKASFKVGTQRLINCDHEQQKHKLMTIYLPNKVEVRSFAELVYLNIKDYQGGDDVKQPESYNHYANAIYYRNDRNEDGTYIPAN
ncbi:MAG: hypothetical protein PQJ49_04505 [Sphaerochaetaceae bacterium]|nr:hypothetical protein [Sphaerochaetaceae bacterium]